MLFLRQLCQEGLVGVPVLGEVVFAYQEGKPGQKGCGVGDLLENQFPRGFWSPSQRQENLNPSAAWLGMKRCTETNPLLLKKFDLLP